MLKPKTKVTYFTATLREQDQRVDNFLMRHLKNVPKALVYRIIRKGEVRVNQKRVQPDVRLNENDIIRIPPVSLEREYAPVTKLNEEQSVWVKMLLLAEEEDFLVVNKPDGISVHAGSDTRVGLIEALRIYRQDLKFIELVHRLDRATSGLVLIAKKPSTLKVLHTMIREHKIQKKYHVLVFGQWPRALNRIDTPVEGKESLTTFQILKTFNGMTLLEATLHTGRQHQIRIHVSQAGFPIVGDVKYGDFEKNHVFVKQHHLKTMFLHARSLKFTWNDQIQSFEAPYPGSWQKVL